MGNGRVGEAGWENIKKHPAIGEEIVAPTRELSHLAALGTLRGAGSQSRPCSAEALVAAI